MKGNRAHALEATSSGGANDDALQPSYDPKLCITVVHTTPDGTVAALRAAVDLAKHLSAQITLVAPEIVSIRLSLEKPQVSVEFLKRRYCGLVADAGIMDEQVTIQIWLCRDQEASLKQALTPHSLIVIGGRARWWKRRERRLARWLRTMGHHVAFVDSATKECAQPEFDGGGQGAFFRVLEKETRGAKR